MAIAIVLLWFLLIAGLLWSLAVALRKTALMARIFDQLMPIHWVPSGIWNCMWKHAFMRRHRGRRRCAQSNVSEKRHEMGKWHEIVLAIRSDGRTFERAIFKRAPVLTLAWLEKLRAQKVIGLLVDIKESGNKVSFMGEGYKPVVVDGARDVGAGLKLWANAQDLEIRQTAHGDNRHFHEERRSIRLSGRAGLRSSPSGSSAEIKINL
jgi:hypothetical protein